MNAIARVLTVVCACLVGQALAAGSDRDTGEPDKSASQPAAPALGAPSPTPGSSPATATPAEPASAPFPPAKGGSDGVPTPTSANKPAKIVLRDETLNGQQLKQILSKGYRPEGHGDEVLYCRRESQLGTRIETKVCRTATVILDLGQQGRDITEGAQKNNGNPTLK